MPILRANVAQAQFVKMYQILPVTDVNTMDTGNEERSMCHA